MQKGEKHTANYHVLAVCQGNATLWIAVDNHIARSPLTVWKDNDIQKQHCCQSCFENYKQSKRLNINDKLKHKGEKKTCGKLQTSINCKKIKIRKKTCNKCRHLELRMSSSPACSFCTISDSPTSTDGKQSTLSKSHWQTRTYKRGRLEHALAQAKGKGRSRWHQESSGKQVHIEHRCPR